MRWSGLVVCGPWALACSETPSLPSSTPAADDHPPHAELVTDAEGSCLPFFESGSGWLAGDGARSIPLADGRSVYLFGDTLLGPVDSSDERGITMVSNTVGVAQCRDDRWSIDYFWQDTGADRAAIFSVDGEHVWPPEGFFVDGRLHVILTKVVKVDYGLKFDYGGALLATVENPEDPPSTWSIAYATLSTSREFRPSKGVAVVDGYANIFTELPTADYPHPVILTRLPVGELDAPETHLEYLASDRTWKGIDEWARDDSLIVAPEMGPNMYVHYHSRLERWLMFGVDPDNRRHIVIHTAEALEGPWVRGDTVYRFPEIPDPAPDGGEPHIACYAVTEHPELRRDDDGTLVVTYSCNRTRGFEPLAEDLDLYRPKTLLVDLGLQ